MVDSGTIEGAECVECRRWRVWVGISSKNYIPGGVDLVQLRGPEIAAKVSQHDANLSSSSIAGRVHMKALPSMLLEIVGGQGGGTARSC